MFGIAFKKENHKYKYDPAYETHVAINKLTTKDLHNKAYFKGEIED